MECCDRPQTITQWKVGCLETHPGDVAEERPVSLTVNGKVWLTFLCTPTDLEALAAGFLFNENIIQSADDIASVRVCPSLDNVDIWLNRSVEPPQKWQRTSGCTGGMTSGKLVQTEKQINLCEVLLEAHRIGELSYQLFAAQELYRQTGGIHTTALSDGEQILVAAEDIGRHNTLDKISGRCLLEHFHPDRWVLLTTGRVSSEMVQKAGRIQASVVISRSSPTTLSVESAREMGITLIGYARRESFNIYTHPERIRFE